MPIKIDNSLTLFSRGAAMLAEADTIQKAKELKDLALTAEEWAKRKKLDAESVFHCRSYKFRAWRKIGEMLATTELSKGGRPSNKTAYLESAVSPTLKNFGLSDKESVIGQALAAMDDDIFELVIDGELTLTQALRLMRRASLTDLPPLPVGTFRVIYADPPWKYGDDLMSSYGATEYHYPAMSIADLCAMPIEECAAGDAVLFLWVTSPLLFESEEVISAWGFSYKASFVWDKVRHNWGHYNSVRHEFLLICTRGSCLPDNDKLIDSVQSIERTDNHSEKPEAFRQIIDQLYPNGRRLELFARRRAEGWDAYGNQLG